MIQLDGENGHRAYLIEKEERSIHSPFNMHTRRKDRLMDG